MNKDLIAIARELGAIIDTKLGAPYDVIHITPAQLEAFAAASSSDTPAGWKLVPVEPTKEMLDAAIQLLAETLQEFDDEPAHLEIYSAMLAASPLPPSDAVAQPVVDQEPASMSDNGSCGSQVSGKPASAEPDRYKRALEAIIANPGGASAKRIATLALGLDGTEQVSAEAGKGVERDAYVADLIDTFEQLRQILGTPEQDADALIATVRRLAAFDSPQEAAERPVSAYRREAVETIKALGYQWADGKWSAPQEASKVEPVAWLYTAKASEPPMNPIISRTRWSPDNTCHASFDEHPLYLRPTQKALSDEEIEGIGHRKAWRYKYSSDPHHSSTYTFNRMCLIEFARAILAAAGGGEK